MNPAVSLMAAGGVAWVAGWWLESAARRCAPECVPAPPKPPVCDHNRLTDVTSGTLGVVARLCLDCDAQLDVPARRWP